MKSCDCNHLTSNRAVTNTAYRQSDPSRTQTIRRSFEADMKRRFNIIRRSIIKAVGELDVFGLKDLSRAPTIRIQEELGRRQFEFSRADQKIAKFMAWLKEMEERNILEVTTRPGIHQGSMPWTNHYIQSSYQKGLSRSRTELRRQGFEVPAAQGVLPGSTDPIGVAFNQPFHAERVAVIYTRAFNDLKGITSVMDAQISRVLARGLMDGLNPMTIARNLANRVDSVGITRARTLARTEVIAAHHSATIGEYRRWGADHVRVQAEWQTAGFNVCPECQELEGRVFTLDEIDGMIPLHPNCRCVAIPVVPEDPGTD